MAPLGFLRPTMTVLLASRQSPAARLHSVDTKPSHAKIVHLIRHAEGTHNVLDGDYASHQLIDAPLTEHGVRQCLDLAKRRARELGGVECVVSSTMTRALQTARIAFGDALTHVAHEEWRETVNFLCDVRRDTAELRSDFPSVDFDSVANEADPIWSYYEEKHGSHLDFTDLRESVDPEGLKRRARSAWEVLKARPEREIAVVSHSAFFMHMFSRLEGVVQFEDEAVQDLLTSRGFDNCELRTVAFEAS